MARMCISLQAFYFYFLCLDKYQIHSSFMSHKHLDAIKIQI